MLGDLSLTYRRLLKNYKRKVKVPGTGEVTSRKRALRIGNVRLTNVGGNTTSSSGRRGTSGVSTVDGDSSRT